jgi:pimeloyl-ACP methyl ester carboxylesterase
MAHDRRRMLVVVGRNTSGAHHETMLALADGFGPDRLQVVERAGHFVDREAPGALEAAIADRV